MAKRDLIVFQDGEQQEIELIFDTPLTDVNRKGEPYNLYAFKIGSVEFGCFAEDELHEELIQYNKGSVLTVTKMGKAYKVESLGGSYKKENRESPQKNARVSNNNYGVTWGMCMNNAVRIVIASGESNDMLLRVHEIASSLMDIAVDGLKVWEQERHEKDQNREPNGDDLPF